MDDSIQAGADLNVNQVGFSCSSTSLIAAAIDGQYKCVQLLLIAEADVNATDSDGKTALMEAVRLTFDGDPELKEASAVKCVQLLLKAVAHVNVTDLNGEKAFHYYRKPRYRSVNRFQYVEIRENRDIPKYPFAAGETINVLRYISLDGKLEIPLKIYQNI